MEHTGVLLNRYQTKKRGIHEPSTRVNDIKKTAALHQIFKHMLHINIGVAHLEPRK